MLPQRHPDRTAKLRQRRRRDISNREQAQAAEVFFRSFTYSPKGGNGQWMQEFDHTTGRNYDYAIRFSHSRGKFGDELDRRDTYRTLYLMFREYLFANMSSHVNRRHSQALKRTTDVKKSFVK